MNGILMRIRFKWADARQTAHRTTVKCTAKNNLMECVGFALDFICVSVVDPNSTEQRMAIKKQTNELPKLRLSLAHFIPSQGKLLKFTKQIHAMTANS